MNIWRKKTLWWKLLSLFFLFSFFFFWSYLQAQVLPDAIIVETTPSSFGVNEAVDLTIKAVNADGTTMKDYDGDVFIEVDGIIDVNDYLVPNDGLYSFLPQDQWVKLFSKWLTIKVPGTYTLRVVDIMDIAGEVEGTATVIVWEAVEDVTKDIEVITPLPWAVESAYSIEVLAKAVDLPNSPYQILLNDVIQFESKTTEQWDIDAYLTGAQAGQNILQIRIVDINGVVIGSSSKVAFTYQSNTDNVFHGIDLDPGSTIKQWEKMIFTVHTSEDVTSAELKLSNWFSYPLDRITAGKFTKQILMEQAGSVKASISLIVAWNTKVYSDVVAFVINENIAINNIKISTDAVDKTSVTISWDDVESISKYRVEYGTSPDLLNFSQEVSTNKVVLQNLVPEQSYYVKISPLDATSKVIGVPSDIQEIKPSALWPTPAGEEQAPNCVVNGITISTGQIWDKYYIMWDEIENVERYVVYKSDWETSVLSDMKKVGETTDTRFEYRFDHSTRRYTYNYYAVQAICTDGSELQISSVKKVSVWPLDNVLLLVAVLLFCM